jgi:hypothetical protein
VPEVRLKKEVQDIAKPYAPNTEGKRWEDPIRISVGVMKELNRIFRAFAAE